MFWSFALVSNLLPVLERRRRRHWLRKSLAYSSETGTSLTPITLCDRPYPVKNP
jgi:hypothetical protein